ncbi:DNA/RNA nuclease SfsA [Petroclostridium sp. X23]|uniref:DNA/RNA nuclease SfsA n=1 Tax=Petroclostridium sp. X23 TaxID=3045146 RepID=UPI0024AD4969|nr:DNA/RNA nuclease SfsA [Petroclostridium sp. X23]WHH60691.1 DNA/RNA nuclease SfsA [Petroclostridium sp. X23]
MLIEGILVEGFFIQRLNRFEAIVDIEGEGRLVHVPNTGRLKELLIPGAPVMVKKFNNPKRKTQFGLLLVKKDDVWISIDSANVPNKMVYEGLMNRIFPRFNRYEQIKREVTVGNSRFDFGLFSGDEEYYIEVKGVTLVEDRKAYFPDAPTERGTRHLKELTQLRLQGKGAGVIFIIQRKDADMIAPNDRTDKAFGNALRKAYETGVDMWAYTCNITHEHIAIDKEVAVYL